MFNSLYFTDNEIIKHASNSFLATRISFINMISDLCETTGADVTKVAAGMGLDPRIGQSYLDAGLGYGGYCLPKDIRAFVHIGEDLRVNFDLLREVENINRARPEKIIDRLATALGTLRGKRIGVLGLSFKPGTDDIRESPSLKVVNCLLDNGASLCLHDPQSINNTKALLGELKGRLTYDDNPYNVAEGVEALAVLTAWPEYSDLDFPKIAELMTTKIMIDGSNLLDPLVMRRIGFEYISMGRV